MGPAMSATAAPQSYHTSAPHPAAGLHRSQRARLRRPHDADPTCPTSMGDCLSWDEAQGLVGSDRRLRELQHRLALILWPRTSWPSSRGLRAFGAEQTLDYWYFATTFVAQDPTLGWIIDSLGRNPIAAGGRDVLSGTPVRTRCEWTR